MQTDTARDTVHAITHSDLDREAKLEALRQLERDLLARSVANEEGMSATTAPDDVGVVRAARSQLRDPTLDEAGPPTKY